MAGKLFLHSEQIGAFSVIVCQHYMLTIIATTLKTVFFWYYPIMGKKKKSGGVRSGSRTRINPLTGQVETVTGTKAGKKRTRLPFDDKLRTHDLDQQKKKR